MDTVQKSRLNGTLHICYIKSAYRIDPLAWLDWPWVFLKVPIVIIVLELKPKLISQGSTKKEGNSVILDLCLSISLALLVHSDVPSNNNGWPSA